MNEKLFDTGFGFGPELGSLIMWLYPERHREMGVFWDGQKCVCQSWPDDLETPTDEEIEAAYETYLVEYPVQKLEELRQDIRTQAEAVFNQLAEIVTGETIRPTTIAEWAAKEQIVLAWEAAGKPEPTTGNGYSWAVYEASFDPEKDAVQLLESQLANAKAWRGLQVAMSGWRQMNNARLKAAQSESDLEALRDGMEAELRGLLQL